MFIEPALADVIFAISFPYLIFKISNNKNISILVLITTFFLIANLATLHKFENEIVTIVTTLVRLYLLLVLIILASVFSRLNKTELQYCLRWFVYGGLINCFFILVLFITDVSFLQFIYRDEFKIRYKGFFQDANVLGPHLILAMLFCWYCYKSTLKGFLFQLLLLIGVFLTYSRASWAGVFIVSTITYMTLLFFGRLIVNRRLLALSISLLLIVFMSLPSFVSSDKFIFYYESFQNRASLQEYDNDRFDGQRLALDLFIKDPLGYGPGSTVKRYNGVMEHNDPHNNYLKIAVETGFLGVLSIIILYGFVLFSSLKVAKRNNLLGALLFSGYVYFLICSMIVDTVHWRSFYVLMALIVGVSINKRLENDSC
ncbi:O-antigen ligase family protein [Vibrio cyclitrophicus]